MRVALFADGFVGVQIAKYLSEHFPEDLILVVTIARNEIFDFAQSSGIPACVFDDEVQMSARLSEDCELGVLAWWPKLLKAPLLEVPRYGFINTHPSMLPYNRGKHYNFWALVEQAPFGVTLHRVDPGVDTGEIVAQQEIAYNWEDTGGSLFFKAREAMLDLFKKTYPTLRTGEIQSTPQPRDDGSSHHSSELEMASHIDLDRSYRARDLLNLLRARTFEGHPGCWFEDAGEQYEISIKMKRIKK